MMNQSSSKRWNPTSNRDKSLDQSYMNAATPRGGEQQDVSQMDSTRIQNKSITRDGETALVNRLFS